MQGNFGLKGQSGVSPVASSEDHRHPTPRVWTLDPKQDPNTASRIPNSCNGFAYDVTYKVLWGLIFDGTWIQIVGHDLSALSQPNASVRFTGITDVK